MEFTIKTTFQLFYTDTFKQTKKPQHLTCDEALTIRQKEKKKKTTQNKERQKQNNQRKHTAEYVLHIQEVPKHLW